ncbi:MAG: hypothetical protein ABFS56_19815 [Pseudomonadota bacterium]
MGVYHTGIDRIPDGAATVLGSYIKHAKVNLKEQSKLGYNPEDLVFQETADSSNFQGRYVLRHPWTGTDNLKKRQEQEG